MRAIELTLDHKPENKGEKHRIEKLGGYVKWYGLVKNGRPIKGTGVYRVNGNLSLSRAVGDRAERPCICSKPDIRCIAGDAVHDTFIISATDGLWDVFSSQEAVAFVYQVCYRFN